MHMHARMNTHTHTHTDAKWYPRYSVSVMIRTGVFLKRVAYLPLKHLIQMLAQESFIKLNLLHHLILLDSSILHSTRMHPNRNVRNVMNVQNEVTIGQLLANIKMAERLNPDIRTNYPYQLYSVIQADRDNSF